MSVQHELQYLPEPVVEHLSNLFDDPHRRAVAIQGAASAMDRELGVDRLVRVGDVMALFAKDSAIAYGKNSGEYPADVIRRDLVD